MPNSELPYSTEAQNFGKLKLAQRNEIRLGGEFTADQRLSGLASTRMRAPAGASSPPKGGRKDVNFQSLN